MGIVLLLVAGAVGGAAQTRAATTLPPLPAGWPRTLQIGLADSPGGAAALRRSAPFGFRYQYLAGGVNTGQGWATWNPDGAFVTSYVKESVAAHVIPVLTYYMLLQSKPGGGDEAHADLSNAANVDTMRAYWADVSLLFQRIRGATQKPVVVHVEPDFWGYVQQAARGDDASTVPAAVASTGIAALASLPNTAAGFAQAWVKLRDQLAPNAILAYHMSGWGTKHDIVYEDPPDATVRAYATRSAAFERSLHARWGLSFEDFSDRDAGFYEKQQGNKATWFTPADFHRHLLYAQTFVRLTGLRMAAWQIPLGNTLMRAMDDTWGHYQDNRVQWLLGAQSRAHLAAYVKAGFAGFLFGGGADGTTCACDARHDGVTNPPPIDGNGRMSLSADDDGGYFRAQVRAYMRRGALALPR
jgi:hypothetical protein